MAVKNGKVAGTPSANKAIVKAVKLDEFDTIVNTQEYKSEIARTVKQFGVTKNVAIDQAIVDHYAENAMLQGVALKDREKFVQILENNAYATRAAVSSMFKNGIEVGKIMADSKLRMQHGSWTNYCQTRLGIDVSKAQRFIAMARAVVLFPQLAPVAQNIPESSLADIGRKKDITPGQIEDIQELAENGGASVEKVGEVLAAGKEKRVKELPFPRLPQAEAALKIVQLDEFIGTMASKLENTDEFSKHANFGKWCQEMRVSPQTDLQKAFKALLVYAWSLEESAYATSALIDVTPPEPVVTENTVTLEDAELDTDPLFVSDVS